MSRFISTPPKLITTALTSLSVIVFAASTSFADINTARNFYQFDDRILTSGQPTQELLETASKGGIEVVINLVPKSESIYNPKEAEILEKQGIQYIHHPVNWGTPKVSELEGFLKTMDQLGNKKVLIHCWANARASAFVYAHRVAQSPDNQEQELENLKKVWTEVAGYSLDTNKTWEEFLEKNVHKKQ